MKAYSGNHSQGCHKCGGFPGSTTKPVAKLLQCGKCGFFTCNKHLAGGYSKHCPNCEATNRDLRNVMVKSSNQRVKAGGMPIKVVAKSQVRKGKLTAEVEAKTGQTSMGTGAGAVTGASTSTATSASTPNKEKPDSNTDKPNTSENKKTDDNQHLKPEKLEDDRVQAAMNFSIKRESDSLRDQMESLHELATISQSEISVLRENSEGTTKKEPDLIEEPLEEQSLDELLNSSEKLAAPLTSVSQFNVQEEDFDESIDLEALAQIDQLLKEQEQGISLTKKIIADSYFRINSSSGLDACKKYLTDNKSSIHILSVEATELKLVQELKDVINVSDHIFATTALSPKSIQNGKKPNIDTLKQLLSKNRKIIAIGEVMLDLHFAPHTIELQKELFIEQAILSVEKDMPLFISSKNADKEIYELLNFLRNEGVKVQGVIVPVVRTIEMFQMVLDHGFHLLLRPEITHDAEDLYRECLKELPIEKLLLASGQEITPPKRYFGRWNSPEYINETIKSAADLFNMEPDLFIKEMAINFNKLFNSDPKAGDDEFDFTPTALKPTLTMTEEKLLENDIDADGDKLFIKEINDEQLVGDIYFDRDNRLFIYTPKLDFIGSDKFTYIVTDGRGGFDSAVVTINVSREFK